MKLLPDKNLRDVHITVFNPDERSFKTMVANEEWFKEQRAIRDEELERELTEIERYKIIKRFSEAYEQLKGEVSW